MKNKKKLKAKKTKTQEFKTKNSRIFSLKTQNTGKFWPLKCTKFFKGAYFCTFLSLIANIPPKVAPKLKSFLETQGKFPEKLNIPANPLPCDYWENVLTTSLV